MSEEMSYPTPEQLDLQYKDAVGRLGVLDYEQRQLYEKKVSVEERINTIEAEKGEISRLIDSLKYTYEKMVKEGLWTEPDHTKDQPKASDIPDKPVETPEITTDEESSEDGDSD